MHFLKKLSRGISSLFLKLSLFLFAVSFALVSVLGTPDNLKQSLQQSNLYGVAVDEGLNAAARAQQSEGDDQEGALALDSPEIRQAARTAFTPEVIEGWTGQFIDGLYGWLEGKTEQPEFQIDMSEQRNAFANNVANTAEQRIAGLRPCTRQESLQLAQQQIDLFNLPCRPPIDITAEKQRLIAELNSGENFLGGDNVISAADLTGNQEQQNRFQNNPLPNIFQTVNRLPLITAIVGLVAIAGLLWLSDNKRGGVRKIGLIFLGSGLFVLISSLLFSYLFNRMSRNDTPPSQLPAAEAGDGIQAALLEVVKSLFGTFNSKVAFIAAIYLAIAAGILLTLHFRHKSSPTKYKI